MGNHIVCEKCYKPKQKFERSNDKKKGRTEAGHYKAVRVHSYVYKTHLPFWCIGWLSPMRPVCIMQRFLPPRFWVMIQKGWSSQP